MKAARINIRVTKELKEKLKELIIANRRENETDYLTWLIEIEYFKLKNKENKK